MCCTYWGTPRTARLAVRLTILYKHGIFTLIQIEDELETARWEFHSPTALQAWIRTLQKPPTEEGGLSPERS